MTEPGNRFNASVEGKPQPGQWWLQTDKQDRSDAKFFRVFFCGKNSKNRIIFEDADGNTEVDHGCDWSGWRHEPACTGWDWVPKVFPQWYSYKDGPFESLNDCYLIRRDSINEAVFVYRSGKVEKVQYPWRSDEYADNLKSGNWKKLSQQEADEALHPKKPVESPDDWVTQDRVPPRFLIDEVRWVWKCRTESQWSPVGGPGFTIMHRFVDVHNDRFEVRCRRKDLPVVEETEKPKVATVTVYEVLYSDDLAVDAYVGKFVGEKRVQSLRDNWKYVSVVSTKTVEVML